MEPWQSWALITVIVAGAGYYYTSNNQKKNTKGRASLLPEQPQPLATKTRPEGKQRRKREQNINATQDAAPRKAARSPRISDKPSDKRDGQKPDHEQKRDHVLSPAGSRTVDPRPVGTESSVEIQDEADDDAEFAKMLSNAQVGTSLAKTTRPSENQPHRKKSKASKNPATVPNGHISLPEEPEAVGKMSPDPALVGADVDNDVSSASIPEEREATSSVTPSGTDVADMLPAAPKGPSILRIIESTKPLVTRQPKTSKKAPEPETKKQRQNRRKKEEAKAIREEDEKERRVLLETQLRTAREAEGRPARNGLGLSGAWDKSQTKAPSGVAPVTIPSQQTLLDTLENGQPTPPDSTTFSINGNNKSPRLGENGDQSPFLGVDESRRDNDAALEEEQPQSLRAAEDHDNWTTVAKGGKGAKRPPTIVDGDLVGSPEAPKSAGARKAGHKVSEHPKSLPDDHDDTVISGFADPESDSNLGANGTKIEPSTSSAGGDSTNGRGGLKRQDVLARVYPTDRPVPPTGIANDAAIDSANYPRPIASRWLNLTDREKEKRRAHIKAHLDRQVWNYDNIHVHPDFEPGTDAFELRFALIGSPMDSDWIDVSADGIDAEHTSSYRANDSKWATNGMSRDFDETYPDHPRYAATKVHHPK